MESTSLIYEAFGNVSIPDEYKISDKDILDESVYKKKLDALIKFLVNNNASIKQLDKTIHTQYYAIIGTTFGTKGVTSHGSTVSYLTKYINKYCSDKSKTKIKKDIEKTINALNKIVDNGKELNKLQKDWMKDIENALKLIK